MYKKWKFKETPDSAQVSSLQAAINVSEPIAQILCMRGIDSLEKAKHFFRPSLSDLHDPFLMKDMDVAVDRLVKALENKEKILVYGDYDVDGTTSVALFYGFLSRYFDHLDYYIPDRYQEGYGVSQRGIAHAIKEGFSLVITIDCGIKAVEKVRFGKEAGLDFIICDHHNPGENLPEAVAVLDPKRKDCQYPFDELSGCGIAFKYLQAYCSRQEIPETELLDYLDLVAISIGCDIVPIEGENRILAKFGLDKVRENPRTGIQALIDVAELPQDLNIGHLVFGIGPRINAAGRIAHANKAVHLLLSESYEEAKTAAYEVNKNNITRREYDESITNEAIGMIEAGGRSYGKTTVLFKDDWHKGIIGIVASRCIEKYYRPTIILTHSNGKATGSARSVSGFDIYEAITSCEEHLLQYGGHKYAAGLTMEIDAIPAFAKKFEEIVAASIQKDQLIPNVNIDLVLRIDQINEKFYNIIKQMAPFGPANMRPMFISEVVFPPGAARVLKEKHLKLLVKDPDGAKKIDVIGFGLGNFYADLRPNEPFFICYTIEENEYKGIKKLQLMLKDIKMKRDF
ncbi:single-stranded-DNA-specific exonuclease RecJ [Flexithrix dorotheae]|uniref:single-stranded-DNA-specific exonuclease RecJ n=1 Tax=Flexithrix dorotheae TaxID=70993 RepID=UPI00036B8241|nr:single-stranded-DNA-specific exonuclease RecJ [Flexithrix dorotheae]